MNSGSAIEKGEAIQMGYVPVVERQEEQEESQGERPKVIVIGGPTCCGKTQLAALLAQTLAGEVISADSMQVYQGMDIGTAKPTEEQRAASPHHMIDVCPVNQPFNVVDFFYDARRACQSILAKNHVPIVVGGAGFYLHAFLYGPPEGPPSVPEIRQALEEELEKYGVEALYERLQELDPAYAKTITDHDRHKIVRALEIIASTRRPVSTLSWGGRTTPIDYDFRCWFLHRPKDVLYERIEARCERMIDEGFIDEVTSLEKKGLRDNPQAASAIGYRLALKYLASERTTDDFNEFVRQFKQSSRHYAKRQFTWFRRESMFRWLDIELHDLETAADMILNDYEH